MGFRTRLEYEVGDFAAGETYLERLLEALPPGSTPQVAGEGATGDARPVSPLRPQGLVGPHSACLGVLGVEAVGTPIVCLDDDSEPSFTSLQGGGSLFQRIHLANLRLQYLQFQLQLDDLLFELLWGTHPRRPPFESSMLWNHCFQIWIVRHQ